MAEQYNLGSVEQIPPGEGRNFEAGGRRVAVFRQRDGRVFATQAACPHRGGPLCDGLVGDGVLVCPLHERRFDLATGDSTDGSASVETYAVALDGDGRLTIELP
jgi:nitrite reductase (NADH) small subunit